MVSVMEISYTHGWETWAFIGIGTAGLLVGLISLIRPGKAVNSRRANALVWLVMGAILFFLGFRSLGR